MITRRLSRHTNHTRRSSRGSQVPYINTKLGDQVNMKSSASRQRRNNLFNANVLDTTMSTQEILSPIPAGADLEIFLKKHNEAKKFDLLLEKVILYFKKIHKILKEVTREDVYKLLGKLFSTSKQTSESGFILPISNKLRLEAFLALRVDLVEAGADPDVENFCRWIIDNTTRIKTICKLSKETRTKLQK
ncbi:unnamed protein product [Moneuplotes crassus]|uniref:Uncharacterized protein n=1 Tax=Euplotes crassus TaxID=5936 RepID=A0AAD1UBZ2_EUPCR|nr:unnamed protein product [Moneuplotes crassus]